MPKSTHHLWSEGIAKLERRATFLWVMSTFPERFDRRSIVSAIACHEQTSQLFARLSAKRQETMPKNSTVTVRAAVPADYEQWLPLWKAMMLSIGGLDRPPFQLRSRGQPGRGSSITMSQFPLSGCRIWRTTCRAGSLYFSSQYNDGWPNVLLARSLQERGYERTKCRASP